MNNEHKNIKDELMERIRSGTVEMHSSSYFALRVGALFFCVVLALIISVFIFNFIFFSFRLSEQSELLGFGPRGLLFFLLIFPWKLLVLDGALLFAAERLLRQFRLGYRHSVSALLLSLLILTCAFGFALDRGTSLNDDMLERAHHHVLGPAGEFYEAAPRPWSLESGVCKCVIDEVSTSSVVAHHLGATSTVLYLIFPKGFATTSVHVGDVLFIAGDRDGDSIEVFGVHEHVSPQQH
jgi:hypothetical protein